MRARRSFAALLGVGALTVAGAANATVTPTMFVDATEKLSVPSAFLTTLGQTFPESVHIGALFLSSAYNPNLLISAPAKLRLSFLAQGANYHSTLGYFTWTTTGSQVTVVDRQLVFPECSGSGQPLAVGDTVTLRDASGAERVFQPGEQVGFFIVSNGWTGSAVAGWDESSPGLPSSSAAANASVANGVMTTVDDLNPENSEGHPELARHAVMLQMDNVAGAIGGQASWVIGFEDMKRTGSGCDNDFNDVMFKIQAYTGETYATPDDGPISASVVPAYDPTNPDPDGDGVTGLNDFFPNDPTRAFVVSTPAVGYETVAFEDLYPGVGDADYNDAVFQYAIDEVLSASNQLKQVQGTFHLIARGAGLDHHFGLAIHGVPSTTTGTLEIERFASDGTATRAASVPIAPMIQQGASGTWMLRLDDLVVSDRAVLPPGPSSDHGFSNTWSEVPDSPPASFRFIVTFDEAMDPGPLGAPPFDPYLSSVHADGLYDIHRPGMPALPGRPSGLPAETTATSFIDPNGYPFALLVPYDFRYPLERVHISRGGRGLLAPFPQFDLWRTSGGVSNATWFTSPRAASPACEIDAIGTMSRDRPWTLLITQ